MCRQFVVEHECVDLCVHIETIFFDSVEVELVDVRDDEGFVGVFGVQVVVDKRLEIDKLADDFFSWVFFSGNSDCEISQEECLALDLASVFTQNISENCSVVLVGVLLEGTTEKAVIKISEEVL